LTVAERILIWKLKSSKLIRRTNSTSSTIIRNRLQRYIISLLS
jgi:hypothetical protein